MTSRIAGLLLVALSGCSLGKTRHEQGQAGPGEATNLTTIRTSDAEFIGGSGLTVHALPDSVRYQITVNGDASGDEQWSMVTQLDANTVQAGRGSATVQPRPAAVGTAEVNRTTSEGLFAQGSAGNLSFELSKGHISGEVTGAVPDILNATFEGALGVVCYVPGGGVTTSEDGGPAPVLVLDETLEKPACELVRPWAPAK